MKKNAVNFDNFYVHEGNRVAFLAAQKIVQFPGEIFNPFYVYCTGSLGKTHLLWALFNELSKKQNLLFFTGKELEKYLDETREFNVPILVDDVSTISDKYQDTLLTMVDVLLANNKQACFSGNAAPRELKNFNAKLASRFEGGLVCEIQPPKEMALVELVKKKTAEKGVIIPDAVALELAQLSGGSFRTIDGMVNRLVAYASLGNISLDVAGVRLILKEFYPRGIYSPVSSLIEELKKNASDVLVEISEKTDARTEYKEKIYIWEMKGFDTSVLKPLMEGDVEVLGNAYSEFIKKVERLIELQKKLGALDSSASPNEAMQVETMLFSPDKIDEIEKLIEKIKTRSEQPKAYRSFRDFVIGECNKTVYELYSKTILPNLGKKFNPFMIFGQAGTGKTRFLEAVLADLVSRDKDPLLCDLAKKCEIPVQRLEKCGALVIDNLTTIFSASETQRSEFFKVLLDFIKNDKGIFIASEPLPDDLKLTDDEKMIFQFGIEATLHSPSRDVIESIIKSRVPQSDAARILQAEPRTFTSFNELFEFIGMPGEEAGVIPAAAAEEVVNLGLPGEEPVAVAEGAAAIQQGLTDREEAAQAVPVKEPSVEVGPEIPAEKRKEAEAVAEQTVEKIEETVKVAVSEGMTETSLKKAKEGRLIVPELSGELIDEKY